MTEVTIPKTKDEAFSQLDEIIEDYQRYLKRKGL